MLVNAITAMVLITAAGPQPERTDEFASVYRHRHYFLVWNAKGTSPRIKLASKGYYVYADPLRYQIIDANSRALTDEHIQRDTKAEVSDLPVSPLYLVFANPGYNGVRFRVDRPYGIVADRTHRLGLNRPRGRVYFYVPPTCERFRVVAQSESPREGGRVEVHSPDGIQAAHIDGDLDKATGVDVPVPAQHRGRVWSLVFMRPTGQGLFLDDLNVHLEGDLPRIVVPRAEWARNLIPKLAQ